LETVNSNQGRCTSGCLLSGHFRVVLFEAGSAEPLLELKKVASLPSGLIICRFLVTMSTRYDFVLYSIISLVV